MWFALRLTTTLVFSESFCKLVTQKKQSEVIIYFEIGRNQPKMDSCSSIYVQCRAIYN